MATNAPTDSALHLLRAYLDSERGRTTPRSVRARLHEALANEGPLKALLETLDLAHVLRLIVEMHYRRLGEPSRELDALKAEFEALVRTQQGELPP